MRSIDKILSKSRAPAGPSPQDQAGDKRFAPRRDSALPALIHFDSSTATIPCMVRNVSSTGARLELRENWYSRFLAPPDVNDHIRLVLRVDGMMYHCKVVRRGETELGVTFVAAPETVGKPVEVKPRLSHILRKKTT